MINWKNMSFWKSKWNALLATLHNWTGNSVSKAQIYFHTRSTNLWLAASTIVCRRCRNSSLKQKKKNVSGSLASKVFINLNMKLLIDTAQPGNIVQMRLVKRQVEFEALLNRNGQFLLKGHRQGLQILWSYLYVKTRCLFRASHCLPTWVQTS